MSEKEKSLLEILNTPTLPQPILTKETLDKCFSELFYKQRIPDRKVTIACIINNRVWKHALALIKSTKMVSRLKRL